jgi:hypothetical protein
MQILRYYLLYVNETIDDTITPKFKLKFDDFNKIVEWISEYLSIPKLVIKFEQWSDETIGFHYKQYTVFVRKIDEFWNDIKVPSMA